jgi:hypothetical protein
MSRDSLANRLVPIVSAVCPFADQLSARSCDLIAGEVSHTLYLQSRSVRTGLLIYLWLFEISAGVRHRSRFSHLSREVRRETFDTCRFPFWSLFRRLVSTLISLNAFDYLNVQDAADAFKRPK